MRFVKPSLTMAGGVLLFTHGLAYAGARSRNPEEQRRHRQIVKAQPWPNYLLYEILFGLGEYFGSERKYPLKFS